jgi:hypothetical protein
MNEVDNKKKIFRFKFSKDIMDLLTYFGKLHQYDNRSDYKEAWKKWYNLNSDVLLNEERRIINLGYDGNVEDKMYKAARYYFRKLKNRDNRDKEDNQDKKDNRDNREKEDTVVIKKQRTYIMLSSEILNAMDKYIKTNNQKPSVGYEDFCKLNSTILNNEKLILKNNNLDNNLINYKIKKTYKNRYYLINKRDN